MIWKNLQENKCPKCNTAFGSLAFSKSGYIRCYKCGFVISEQKMNVIVHSQITQDLERKWTDEFYQRKEEYGSET